MRLDGKVAIVTGGGSGFGEGIVEEFISEGARVVLVDRNGDNAKRVAACFGDACVPMVADVSTAEGFVEARDLALEKFGGVNILVNNA